MAKKSKISIKSQFNDPRDFSHKRQVGRSKKNIRKFNRKEAKTRGMIKYNSRSGVSLMMDIRKVRSQVPYWDLTDLPLMKGFQNKERNFIWAMTKTQDFQAGLTKLMKLFVADMFGASI